MPIGYKKKRGNDIWKRGWGKKREGGDLKKPQRNTSSEPISTKHTIHPSVELTPMSVTKAYKNHRLTEVAHTGSEESPLHRVYCELFYCGDSQSTKNK